VLICICEYKEETSRIRSISIKSSAGRKLCFWVEENCKYTENSFNKKQI
jgi:hypothetical protein